VFEHGALRNAHRARQVGCGDVGRTALRGQQQGGFYQACLAHFGALFGWFVLNFHDI